MHNDRKAVSSERMKQVFCILLSLLYHYVRGYDWSVQFFQMSKWSFIKKPSMCAAPPHYPADGIAEGLINFTDYILSQYNQ